MHRCACSTRALEACIHDATKINLRQQRAQRFFLQYRSLGSRPSSRQLETVRNVDTDDSFLPFDAKALKRSLGDSTLAKRNGKEQHKPQNHNNEAEEREWHAEIELAVPSALLESERHALEIHDEHIVAGELPQGEASENEDGVLRSLHTTAPPPAEGDASHVQPHDADVTLAKSRAESRQNRKLRRMEAGRYNRAPAEAQTKEEMVDYQVETVLHKLDAEVDGPRQARAKALERFKKRESIKQAGDKWAAAKSDKAATTKDRWDGPKPKKEVWQVQKGALEHKFGETGWQPRKRLSPDTLEGIRALHASDPAAYSTETLSEHFRVTPEAIRRILKSKWRPDDEETEDRRNRWERRGVKKWQDMAEQGARPPAKWRAMGVGSEEGPKEDKVPKRRKKSRGDEHLSWDEVVGGSAHEEDLGLDSSLAERIL
ncbi:hypothetical protein LTR85_007642 [Meristemomyces frigidus]|nr:hypothetical protein LTR85_007642 [Meristemomyces frigidus]